MDLVFNELDKILLDLVKAILKFEKILTFYIIFKDDSV